MEKQDHIKEGAEAAARGLDAMEDPDVIQAINEFVESILRLVSVLQLKQMQDEQIASMVGGSFNRILFDWARS